MILNTSIRLRIWLGVGVLLVLGVGPAQVQASWWDTDWGSRIALTFDNTGQPENLGDFPVLVVLDGTRIDYGKTQNLGQDVRFVDADDSTVLAHEIERWDELGLSYVWVKVPQVDASSGTDFIYMYYDHGTAPDAQNRTAVWSSGYAAVWHLDDDPTGGDPIVDSSPSLEDGVGSAGMDATNLVTGQVGRGLEFDGSTDFVRVPSDGVDALSITGDFLTLECWLKRNGDTPGNAWMIPIGRQLGIDIGDAYLLSLNYSDPTMAGFITTAGGNAQSLSGAIPDATWTYIVGVQDATNLTIYTDGSQAGQIATGGQLQTDANDVTFGASENGPDSTVSEWFVGTLDETRISNVARSSRWIAAQHLSMTDVFITYGTPETALDSDGDGLWDTEEDANADLDNDPATNPGPDTDGDTFPNYLDADDDDDGTPTASENADPNADGDPRDAIDGDRDGQPDYLDDPTGISSGTVDTEQKISDTAGGFLAILDNDDRFGTSVAGIGDVDDDGINDMAVGAQYDDDGGTDRGAIYVLFLNANGTVKAEQKISNTTGGLTATLDDSDLFGVAVTGIGDVDGDGINDIAVGALLDDDGGIGRGAVYVLFLNANGTVKAEQKISDTEGGLTATLDDADGFGIGVTGIGDVDGDGINDIAVGAYFDDDGGTDRGAVHVLFLNANGTVKAEQKISDTAGGLTATLDDNDIFGNALAGIGDLDGDGVNDLAVGAEFDDDGGADRGAVHVLFLNNNGTVKAEQKISDTAGGLTATLDDNDYLGNDMAGIGDLDDDGINDIAVSAMFDDDGGTDRGAVHVLFLNANGTVKAEQKISDNAGALTATLDDTDRFGRAVAGIGDLDGDGLIDIAVGAHNDDDGGLDRGAVYVLHLATVSSVDLEVVKTVDDATPNESDTVVYTVTVTNNGPNAGTGISVTDLLPAGLTYVSDTPSQGAYVSGTGVWTVGGLANAANATLDITATVDTGTAGTTINNTASVSALDQTDLVSGNDSDVLGITVNSVDLGVVKSVDNGTPNESDTITYTVTVTNNGPDAGTGIAVTDLLPTGVSYVSDVASQGSYVSGTGVWTVGGLANAANATLDITATVDAGTAGTTINNTASVQTLDQTDMVSGNDSATAIVVVESVDIQVTKTVDDNAPNEEDTVVYTITVENNGPSTATGITIRDAFPAGVSFVSASPSQGSYDDAAGIWSLDSLTTDPGGAVLDLTFTIDTGTAGSTLVNNAQFIGADQTDINDLNDVSSAIIAVQSVDLQVTKTISSTTPNENDTIIYTVKVTNNGPSAGTGISVADLLPAGVTYVSDTPSQGSYVSGTGQWTVGGLAAGASDSLLIVATVDVGTAGNTILNTAAVADHDQIDTVPGNDTDSVALVVQSIDLEVSKAVDQPMPMESELVTYTVLVTNHGPTDATGVELEDLLPSGVTFDAATATRGIYNEVTGRWAVGPLAVDETVTLTLGAFVNSGTSGSTITNTASVSVANESDGDPGNDSDSVEVTVVRFRAGSIYAVAAQPEFEVLTPGGPQQEVMRLTVHNLTTQSETFTAFTVTNTTTGPPLQVQRDQEWSELSLYRLELPSSTLLPVSSPVSFASGEAAFNNVDTECAPGDSLVFVIEAAATLAAGDGDLLDLAIVDETRLAFGRVVPLSAEWPLAPAGHFTVDGMVAAQLGLEPAGSGNLQIESERNLALNFVIPANGFTADELSRLNVVNLGTARSFDDLTALEAWIDQGDGLFDPVRDLRLGEFSFSGSRWELTGLAHPVPLAGSRVFVSVDVAPLARVGRTVQLAIPALPDVGVGMLSDNDGPRDAPVTNAVALAISAVDRVTFSTVGVSSGTVRPGQAGVVLLHMVATNGYGESKRVEAISFANASTGLGSQRDLDRQLQQLTLRLDGDGDQSLGDLADDPIVGTGVFDSGRTTLDGLSWDIPAEASQHLFLTANVSLFSATDGDVLSAVVADGGDVAFEDPTAVTTSWPLDSGSRWTIDGMVATQIANHGAAVATVGPGDGPLPALDVTIPTNGYLDDQLNAVRVVNLGTASDETDLQELRLWRDEGNGQFDGPGGDIDLGALTYHGSGWGSPFLAEDLGLGGARLFVSVEIAGSPTDSATVRLSIPSGGLVLASGNDGPIDAPVENPHAQLISASPLLSTLMLSPSVSTLGAPVQARMVVRNVGVETVLGVAPSVLLPLGDGGLTLLLGPSPTSFDLSVDAEDTFTWVLDADQLGEIRLVGSAQGLGGTTALTRESAPSESNSHQVLLEASELDLFAVGTMPTSANVDETELVAFNLTFTNPAGSAGSDVLLRHLRLRLEDGAANPIVPADVLTRVTVSEGSTVYLLKTDLETTGSEVDLTLAAPARITTREPVTVSISFDLAAGTQVPRFHMMLWDETSVGAEDAVSRNPVVLDLEEGTYPVSSGFMNLMAGAMELQVTGVDLGSIRVEPGQMNVTLLQVDMENIDTGLLTSDIQLAGFTMEFSDTNGVALPDVTPWIDQIHVRGPDGLHLTQMASAGARHELDLSPLVFLPAGTPRAVTISADLREDALPCSLRLLLPDPALFSSSDANSGDIVSTRFPTGTVIGPTVIVERPATLAVIEGVGALPGTVIIGTEDLRAMTVSVRHPGDPGTARLRLDALTMHTRDQSGAPVIPADVFSSIQLSQGGSPLASVSEPPTSGNTVTMELSNVIVIPGQSIILEVLVGINAVTPESSLELRVEAEGLLLVDDNTGAAVGVEPEPGAYLPLSSGVALLQVPPQQLVVQLASRLPTVLAADGREIDVGVFRLTNTAPAGAGPIRIEHLELRAADRGFAGMALGRAATAISLHHVGAPWASVSSLDENDFTVTLAGVQPLEVQPGEPIDLQLRVVLANGDGVESVRFGIENDDLGVMQPQGALLQVAVAAVEGQSFPLWTEAGTFSAMDLASSYANFPNPFAAGRENTSFVFFLDEPGRVTLTIWSSRGEKVVTLVSNASRAAGLHQEDVWTGHNGRGRTVINDVFLAELVVDYDGGRSERAIRKVAVVR